MGKENVWTNTIGKMCMPLAELGSGFKSDWAGIEILKRYFEGRTDQWAIKDDPKWTSYMTSSILLQYQIDKILKSCFTQSLLNKGKGFSIRINRSFHAEIENGEGIIGYQFLHGTDSTVGDFSISGEATVAGNLNKDHGIQVKTSLTMAWNDKIDPNYKYTTDKVKEAFAQLCTGFAAKSYIIQITWDEQTLYKWYPKLNILARAQSLSK